MTTRTITLTDYPPVRIDESAWPILAQLSDDSWLDNSDVDPPYEQAVQQNSLDRYTLTVRQHGDGRVLVYGVLVAAGPEWGQPARGVSYRGGRLIESPHRTTAGEFPGLIHAVAKEVHIPPRVARECIAALPPVDLE